ncbi:RraA family protein [Spiribacter roseus]|uniref:Cytidyltransferase n=1 Tax=Spiribacter roseus TaxID=1855875 RepID=A0ABV3RX82_9GAMM
MKIVAFVPAKGSSERVPSKNLRILDGEYLFRRKLKQLLSCPRIDEVWLDTESDDLISEVKDLPVRIMKRDVELATNATDGHEMFENECHQVPDADVVIQALCTAPFVDEYTINKGLDQLLNHPEYDSLVAVTRTRQYSWTSGEPDYGRGRIPNSADIPSSTIEAMSLYIVLSSSAEYPKKRFGGKPFLLELSARESIDINYQEDLLDAEMICRGERMTEANYFRILKHNLSSSILSDVTKDLGLDCTLNPRLRPCSTGKILGRVRTLRLRGLKGAELDTERSDAWKGIYNALDSYKFVRSGDVIVCENELPERAYFGDLNCHLAMRSGAVGVVVDGFTRDVENVSAMGLPVYARGAWSNDIKYEGTTVAYNKPIKVGDVEAKNDDIVFADSEGVLIIPGSYWANILHQALSTVENETRIRNGLLQGKSTEEIVESFGFF